MPTTTTKTIDAGGNRYVVTDRKWAPKERNKKLLLGRNDPARSISFKPVGGSSRVPAIVSREDMSRQSPLVASRMTPQETEARRRDNLRSDVVRGLGAGFLAERAHNYSKPMLELRRSLQAQKRGEKYVPKTAALPVHQQIVRRVSERRSNPFSTSQLDYIAEKDPVMRLLPGKGAKRYAAQRAGVLDWSGTRSRTTRKGKAWLGGMAVGAAYGGARYAQSRRRGKEDYAFALGTPPGRKVSRVPLG